MQVYQLVVNNFSPLSPLNTVQQAIERMQEYKIAHFPVAENGEYAGLVKDELLHSLLSTNNTLQAEGGIQRHLFVKPQTYIHDAVRIFYQNHLSVLPVIDENRRYLGVLTLETMLNVLAETIAVDNPGGVIVLEMPTRSYVLSEIARIIEAEETAILSIATKTFDHSAAIELTLKVSRTDLTPVLSSLYRHGYTVKSFFSQDSPFDDSKERFKALMHYLNM